MKSNLQQYFSSGADLDKFLKSPSLHLGCGTKIFPAVLNIDLVKKHPAVFQDDVTSLAKYRSEISEHVGPVQMIMSYHVIEHLPRPGTKWEPSVDTAFKNWHGIMAPGGYLVIECPDFEAVIQEYVDGNLRRKDNIFGLNRGDGDKHMWGFGRKDLADLLAQHGFDIESHGPGTDYHSSLEPCQRIVARKK